MEIMGLGLDMAGEPLFTPQDEADVATSLIASFPGNAVASKSILDSGWLAGIFRSEQQRRVADPGDPRSAGWTYLVNADDPDREAIADALEDLAMHRHMEEPRTPLVYSGESEDDWLDWMDENWHSLDLDDTPKPQYVLIVGGPKQVPFPFQSLLDVSANVGRVAFDHVDDLAAYADKLCRLECADAPVVDRSALFFGPDGGLPDPTYFSHEHMVKPLVDETRTAHRFEVEAIVGGDATKKNLEDALVGARPALVYTASHGLGATSQTAAVQRRHNGSICCETQGAPLGTASLYGADDVPDDFDEPFLEGAVFFQFACFGYGTPAESEFAKWVDGIPDGYTEEDFVAALPKRLLAHPKGPIAFIGHLDVAFLHGFTDADDPHIGKRWHSRIAPFKTALDRLLEVQPAGLAMQDLNSRYNLTNAMMTRKYHRKPAARDWTPQDMAGFVDKWITRGDAQNYLIFGDPAARLRIPAPS